MMERKSTSALVLSCAIFVLATFFAITSTSCSGSGEGEATEYNEAYYFGSWFSEDGDRYYFSEEGRGTFLSGSVGGTFNYTVNVTIIHMHVTYWSEKYHTIWKNDIDASYYPEKDLLNIGGVFYYRKDKVPKKDEAQTEPVDTLATTDTVAGK